MQLKSDKPYCRTQLERKGVVTIPDKELCMCNYCKSVRHGKAITQYNNYDK